MDKPQKETEIKESRSTLPVKDLNNKNSTFNKSLKKILSYKVKK